MLKIKQLVAENTASHKMTKELSGVTIILIIGGGVLAFAIVFILAKRQIMRFAIRNRRGPHVPVGHDATKSIKKEIERRLDCIQRIAYEPQLLPDDDSSYILQPDSSLPPYYYRLKAVDDIKILENEISKQDGSVRLPRDSLRAFLITTLAAPMAGSSQRLIHQFCDMYEHARHDPSEFSNEEYEAYRRLLMKLLDAAKSLKTFSNSRKSSPSRTPVKKQTKVQSLLDPSRLKPPPATVGSGNMLSANSRINYGLGIQHDSLTTTGKQSNDEEQSPPHNITLHLDANEIITVSPDSSVI
ncbi:uncharacterized protein C1orf43 homolog [Contarinia nasturtii]|uniref:uncharacterized protein C1orf43 homolog n=1 Tax=Contarinia nasturtii TaxID=265458 RepID=UPI0012D4399A|nr:uncharacterized protein C1orf43 homolog [Contarinia nasturtii]